MRHDKSSEQLFDIHDSDLLQKGDTGMGMKDMFLKQCTEQKEQLERSLADIVQVISMVRAGVKQYPENTAFELATHYRGLLKEAELTKETCERKIVELAERIDELNG
jgi:hypothetical protein